MLLTKQKKFFSNRPKFPTVRLKLNAKVRKVKNSKKIFKLQIKKWEQVFKNDKRFNVGKMKKVPQYFQRLCEDTLFISKNAQFRPKLPHLTLNLCWTCMLARCKEVCLKVVVERPPLYCSPRNSSDRENDVSRVRIL